MTNGHTMSKMKVAVSLEASLLERLDGLVRQHLFPSRSGAIEAAIEEKLARLAKTRLASECAKLDPREERALAEEGLTEDAETWPAY